MTSLLLFTADVFAFDRAERLLLVAPLSEVLRDAADGAEQDERQTIRPEPAQ